MTLEHLKNKVEATHKVTWKKFGCINMSGWTDHWRRSIIIFLLNILIWEPSFLKQIGASTISKTTGKVLK